MGDKTALLLCEKPDVAVRMARALDEKGNPSRKILGKFSYYEANRDQKKLVVVSALGHLYTVAPRTKDREAYPVFEFEWVPKYVAERNAKATRRVVEVISSLSEDAQEYIVATDYDLEGATIGYTLLKYACGGKEKEAKRMKFSTLTEEELRRSYSEILPHIEFSAAEAGECRHFLDAIYGINLSRAMTSAAKHASGRYVTLSTGRVQGPTLRFLVDREKEIDSFVPIPYWTIKANVEINDRIFEAYHETDAIGKIREANEIVGLCKGQKGEITEVEVKRTAQNPPVPFDLSSLQNEAYAFLRYSPKRTADTAERLYLDALISYPRTSSQKLPSVNYRAIIESLGHENKYRELAAELLRKDLVPNEGKRTDPAHPAIYPTGNLPDKTLDRIGKNLFDLIVRRFMSVFGEPSLQETTKACIIAKGHRFYLRGRRTLKEGWMLFYRSYVRLEEVFLPDLEKGKYVQIRDVVREDKFTRPPPRYNPSSLLRKMEDEGIGTKATRADIIETLYNRGYLSEERMMVSDLGFDVTEILNRYCPEVLSASFTKELEARMEKIQNSGETAQNVLSISINRLRPVMDELKKNEKQIGEELSEAITRSYMKKRIVGNCPKCETGKLVILRSRRTGKRFLGCSNFFKGICKTSFPLPQTGVLRFYPGSCKVCTWPMLQLVTRSRRPWVFCVNPDCPSKEVKR